MVLQNLKGFEKQETDSFEAREKVKEEEMGEMNLHCTCE